MKTELDAEVADLKRRVDEVRAKLDAEEARLLEQLEAVRKRRQELGGAPKRTYKPRAPKASAPATAAPSDDAPAAPVAPPAAPPAPAPAPAEDHVAQGLLDLKNFWGILSERDKLIVRIRATGKPPSEIGQQLKLNKSVISNVVFNARLRMEQAKERAEKAERENAA